MAKSSGLAYDLIRTAILEGRYPPDFHLREAAIATEIGVSRTPVREALRRLAADGYVIFRPNQGAFVTAWSDESFFELISLRAELAGLAARGAATRIPQEEVGALASVVEAMAKIKSDPQVTIDQQTSLNLQFHDIVFRNCGNRWVEMILRQTSHVSNVQRAYYSYTQDDWLRGISRYNEVVEAMRTADGEWAATVLKSHFLASRNAVIARRRRAEPAAPVAPARRRRPVRN